MTRRSVRPRRGETHGAGRAPTHLRLAPAVPSPLETVQAPSSDLRYIVSGHRLLEFAELARRQNWDLVPLLHASGIIWPAHRPRCLGVTKPGLAELIKELWRLTDDDLLGLGPQPVPRGTFRLLAYALSCAPDLGTALTRYQTCRQAVHGLPTIDLVHSSKLTTMSLESRRHSRADDIVTESLLAVAHRIMNWALRHPIPLAEVWLPRSAPREADEYEHLFGAPVRFSAPSAALLFDTRVLAEPISRHPDEVESFLATAPLGLLDEYGSGQPYAEQVRQLLRARLGIEAGSADDVAAQMGMSRQTLHRRLREEGASLSNLKNEVLRDAAVESLGKAEETITALSHRLGFSEPGAFTRAFRRWTGMPPSAYRSTRADRGERAVGFV